MPCDPRHENRMTFVAGGEAHSGAIDKRGRVFMWGAGDSGRLGFPELWQHVELHKIVSLVSTEQLSVMPHYTIASSQPCKAHLLCIWAANKGRLVAGSFRAVC